MDNPTALRLARYLCSRNHKETHCFYCIQIAAALKRAFADGMEYAIDCEVAVEMGSMNIDNYRSFRDIRAEADQLEGK